MTEIDIDLDLFDFDTDADDIIEHFSTPAHTLEVGDQIIIEGEHVRILSIEDSEDIDEVIVNVENFSGGDERFSLFADDEYTVWSI